MTPSFFTLFKRGRYYRSLHIADTSVDSTEVSKVREERERFLVAAIAFCLKHDQESFGKHFFEKICKEPTDPDIANASFIIEHHDLDLVITNATSRGQFVYVVEAKAGADLKDHQNPAKVQFWDAPNGYGRNIKARFPGATAIRFVVLGHNETITPAYHPKGWTLFQRSWSDLLDRFPSSPLSQDLADLFTRLQVEAFMLKETEHLRVQGDLSAAVDAHRVLTDTCAMFRLRDKYYSLGSGRDEDGSWFFGIDLQPVEYGGDALGNQKRLTEIVRAKEGEPICWFGYQAGAKQSIWFYCGTPASGTEIMRLLRQASLAPEQRLGSDYVIVFHELDSGTVEPDRHWFAKALVAVGLQKPL